MHPHAHTAALLVGLALGVGLTCTMPQLTQAQDAPPAPADTATPTPSDSADAPDPPPSDSPTTPEETDAPAPPEPAEPVAPPPPPEPPESTEPPKTVSVYHVPPSARAAGAAFRLEARVEHDWKAERLWVAIERKRRGAEPVWDELPLERAERGGFVARVPGALVQPPGLRYFIASQGRDGSVRHHFGSPTAPHPVSVIGDSDESLRTQRLARHAGNTSSVTVRGDLTTFGPRLTNPSDGVDAGQPTDADSDTYWRTDMEYRYRLLGFLYDIHFGVGFMRGQRATIQQDATTVTLGEGDSPGANYGSGGLTLELHRNFSTEARLILGANAEGFAAGLGGLIRIGRIAGTRAEFGGELLQGAGSTWLFRFAWDTVPRVPMSLTFENTSWPDTDTNPRANRLYYDAAFELTPYIVLGGRFGVATRNEALDAGWLAGAHTEVRF